MKVTVRPVFEPLREIDVTREIVAAIAEKLWNLYGGNDKLNWLEAELHARRIIGRNRDGSGVPAIVADSRARDVANQDRLARSSASRAREPRRKPPGRKANHRSRRAQPKPARPTMQRSRS